MLASPACGVTSAVLNCNGCEQPCRAFHGSCFFWWQNTMEATLRQILSWLLDRALHSCNMSHAIVTQLVFLSLRVALALSKCELWCSTRHRNIPNNTITLWLGSEASCCILNIKSHQDIGTGVRMVPHRTSCIACYKDTRVALIHRISAYHWSRVTGRHIDRHCGHCTTAYRHKDQAAKHVHQELHCADVRLHKENVLRLHFSWNTNSSR